MGTVLDTIPYTYGDSDWGDLLTGYDGRTISYDSIGNPLSDGKRTYTWEHGRELATVTQDEITWTNTYGADGLRTKRTDGTTTYRYRYTAGQLATMNIDDDVEMWFMYDDNGPLVIKYGNATSHKVYHYELNLQGDVIAIVSTTGERVVEYTYDAWGNVLSITGSAAKTIGVHNPLRYRGYIYDHETGLYYCQSRYYDPEIGRFINADAFTSTGQGLLGNNMFAYCLNNPIRYIDLTGSAAVDFFTEDGKIFDESDLFGRGGGGSSWDVFMSTLDSLASGFNMALGGGRSYHQAQKHHIVPHNNQKYSDEYRASLKEYGFSLTSGQNIIELDNHCGRHTEGYHKFIQGSIKAIDTYANGNRVAFDKAFTYLRSYIRENQWLLYARK